MIGSDTFNLLGGLRHWQCGSTGRWEHATAGSPEQLFQPGDRAPDYMLEIAGRQRENRGLNDLPHKFLADDPGHVDH